MALAICVCHPFAAAQSGVSDSPLGSQGQAKGALMTRDELRSCLKEQKAQQEGAVALERRRGEVAAQIEAARLQKDSVQAEREALMSRAKAAEAFSQRVAAHAQRVALYNQSVAAFKAKPPPEPDAERILGELQAGGAALSRADAELKAEAPRWAASLEPERQSLMTRVRAQQAAAAAAIEQHRVLNADSKAFDDRLEAWQQRCGNRPYLEADERAIRAGN